MRIHLTKLAGAVIIEPDAYGDARGWFK